VIAGAGVRAVLGDKIGYAYADGLKPAAMLEAAKVAAEIASGSREVGPVGLAPEALEAERFSRPRDYPIEIGAEKKIETAKAADHAARSYDARVSEALVSLVDTDRSIHVVNSEGVFVHDRRILTTLRVIALAEEGGLRQRGGRTLSGTQGYELFEKETPAYVAEDAARQAVILLEADEAPAGSMAVVVGNGRGGVLLHEAIGHGFEGDFIRKETSLFTGRLGETVAAETCNIVDDATIPGMRGTCNIDDEGTPGQRTVLIEKGILRGFLYDRLNARLMNTHSTGNGRRQSYRHMPVVRMTNTFMTGGDMPPDEIIASVKKGFYAKRIGGGQVDIASGNFVFEVMEGYIIEKGKVGPPVRGANLIGNGAEVLKKIEMVGNDFLMDAGGGTCGKAGQGVPVGNGVPTVKVSEITVGGTKS
jgi:TldD protein